jgi:peptidoglycan hydrolase-like protein with peptidoglycan-binding domain
MKLIKNYTESNDVIEIQQILRELGYYTGSVDGKFGDKSEKATEHFQKDNNLTADGVIGEKTFSALKNVINKKHKAEEEKQIIQPNSNFVYSKLKFNKIIK